MIFIVLHLYCCVVAVCVFFFFQAEDGIRDLVRSRGLGDVYKRQPERATITNMGAELGATTSVFPSDDVTKAFLKAQGLSLIHI